MNNPFRLSFKTVLFAALMLASVAASFAGSPIRFVNLSGKWQYQNLDAKPCAIFQEGQILLLVNEKGDMATAFATGHRTFEVKSGTNWQIGLIGEQTNATTITWSNGTYWTRKD